MNHRTQKNLFEEFTEETINSGRLCFLIENKGIHKIYPINIAFNDTPLSVVEYTSDTFYLHHAKTTLTAQVKEKVVEIIDK